MDVVYMRLFLRLPTAICDLYMPQQLFLQPNFINVTIILKRRFVDILTHVIYTFISICRKLILCFIQAKRENYAMRLLTLPNLINQISANVERNNVRF